MKRYRTADFINVYKLVGKPLVEVIEGLENIVSKHGEDVFIESYTDPLIKLVRDVKEEEVAKEQLERARKNLDNALKHYEEVMSRKNYEV